MTANHRPATNTGRKPQRRRFIMMAALASLWLNAASAAESEVVIPHVSYAMETLDNGLRVVYAPIPGSTAAHVRMLYHVGSKNESPDRQGFAHMFEHMMFRGSAHVRPEEHMRLIDGAGGDCNAFTGVDQTVYLNTVPAEQFELALWLEADRLASFRVSPGIFVTERRVVEEEWRISQNSPISAAMLELFPNVFRSHPYRWTAIGDMDQLRAAHADELSVFFRRHYHPGNAVLVVAGGIDFDAARRAVRRYFGWIAPGPAAAESRAPAETPVESARKLERPYRGPLPFVTRAYILPSRAHPDRDALKAAAEFLGAGDASRLRRALVEAEKPLCSEADAEYFDYEDHGILLLYAMPLPGVDADAVAAVLADEANRLATEEAAPEEFRRLRMGWRVELINNQTTAESLAEWLGEEALFGGDPGRVNTEWERRAAVGPDDVRRVAAEYLSDARSTTIIFTPTPADGASEEDAEGEDAEGEEAEEDGTESEKEAGMEAAGDGDDTSAPAFPDDYPATPPLAPASTASPFQRGVETTVRGVRVVCFPDTRLPRASLRLAYRCGSATEPANLTGLAGLAADWIRRGPAGTTPIDFNSALEEVGASLSLTAQIKATTARAEFLSDPASWETAIAALRDMLARPALDSAELARLKDAAQAELVHELSDPRQAAGRALAAAVFGDTPSGRSRSRASLAAIDEAAARDYYDTRYLTGDAILVVAGDATPEQAAAWAEEVLAPLAVGTPPAAEEPVPHEPSRRPVILLDNPGGRQAALALGVRAFSYAGDEKYAGWVTNDLLSAGIHARLMRKVRAELGLVYNLYGIFRPGPLDGSFELRTATDFGNVRATIDASFGVLEGLRREAVPEDELAEVRRRLCGREWLSMETVDARAGRWLLATLNGFPEDFLERYTERIGAVTPEAVRALLERYVDPSRLAIVVAAPAAAVREALTAYGEVEVRPMTAD